MAAHVTVTLEYPDQLIADLRRKVARDTPGPALRELQKLISASAGRADKHTAHARVVVASACATQTVTCAHASAVDNTDTLTVAGTELALKAAPSTEDEFAKGTTNATLAANVAACINAHSTLEKIVRASSSGATLTITCLYPGPIGDLVTLAEAGNGFTLGGSALASGASDAPTTFELGYTPST